MLRMMIVEDERWMRKGLEKMLDWGDLNIKHVASASNGQEALELLHSCKPDIIITDVKMPRIDGFGMLDKISEITDRTPKIIIVSGYNDFDYAKKAIQHGVADYILKPVDPEELKKTITKIIDMIRLEKKQTLNFTNLELKNVIYEMLAFSANSSNIDFIPSSFNYCIVFSSNPFSIELVNLIKGKFYYSSVSIGGHQLTIIGSKYGNAFSTELQFYLDEIESEQIIGFSRIKNNINDSFFSAYREAVQVFRTSYNQGNEDNKSFELNISISIEEETKILKALQGEDSKTVKDTIDNVLKKYSAPGQAWIIQFQMYLFLSRYLTTEQLQSHNHVLLFHKFKSINEPGDKLNTDHPEFESMIDDVIKNFNPLKTNHIVSVNEFIDTHYHDSSLSLEQVAEHLNLSPAYLSFIIKKETKSNYTSHVTRRRIESAKKHLLSSSIPIYKISMKVGYNDVKYFLKVFKKETGFTPNHYRELYKQKTE
ncbi:response regulator transcription factor [Pseudogracilibacillus sp. SO10305]|uniref:response regulator transcription factor n=1 Tax=Pseudogracilibacillus sp. SO10305 TaxID=3098292 RepID=UPI00300E089B